jgi:hypothetical protein
MTRDRGSLQDGVVHADPHLTPTVICGIYKTVTLSVILSSLGVPIQLSENELGDRCAPCRSAGRTKNRVELIGIEPTTSGLQSRRSPS